MAYTGAFKSYDHGKGWGFITQEDGKDVFFHRTEMKGRPAAVGDILNFDLGESPTKPGQMVATNVTGGTLGGETEGIVNSFCWSTGYGFIQCGELNLFCHTSEVKGGGLRKGDKVWFDIVPSPKDPEKQVARNVHGGTGTPPADMKGAKGKDGGKGGWGKDGWGKGGWDDGKGKGGYSKGGGSGMMQMMKGMMSMMLGKGPYGGDKGWGKGKGKDKGGSGLPANPLEVEEFIVAQGLDERATTALREADPVVQQTVLEEGDVSQARNPSSLVIGRIRDAKGGGGKGGGGWGDDGWGGW